MTEAGIYLDHAATSPLRPAARQAMLDCWDAGAGNSGSSHGAGREARRRLAEARGQVAALAGDVRPDQVYFTSGATEASNLAIRGLTRARSGRGGHVISTRIEHSASRRACEAVAAEGWRVTLLTPDGRGLVDPTDLAVALTPDTRLVSVIGGHNELGTVQPLREIAEIAHHRDALVHVDAVQAISMSDLADVPWDLLSISAHKLGGPQGVGALVVRGDVVLAPLLAGGSQEGGLRPGTVPVALCAGFGAAAAEALSGRASERQRLSALRDRLGHDLRDAWPDARALGCWSDRPGQALPHILTLGLPGLRGDEVVSALDRHGVHASSSAACLGDARSHVLVAIGLPEDVGALRLSLGWSTSGEDVERALLLILEAATEVRGMSPFERRCGPLRSKAAEAGLALTDAHLAAAEAVFEFHRREQVLPGSRYLSKVLGQGVTLDRLYPEGLPTLASWLAIPVPSGGCRPSGV